MVAAGRARAVDRQAGGAREDADDGGVALPAYGMWRSAAAWYDGCGADHRVPGQHRRKPTLPSYEADTSPPQRIRSSMIDVWTLSTALDSPTEHVRRRGQPYRVRPPKFRLLATRQHPIYRTSCAGWRVRVLLSCAQSEAHVACDRLSRHRRERARRKKGHRDAPRRWLSTHCHELHPCLYHPLPRPPPLRHTGRRTHRSSRPFMRRTARASR